MKNNNNLMYLLMVGGISIAIALGGAGLGIALKEESVISTSTATKVKSPYLYGKLSNAAIPNAADILEAATGNVKKIPGFAVNTFHTLVDGGFWNKIVAIKVGVEKSTEGIEASGLNKNIAGYKNVIEFEVVSTAATNMFNGVKTGVFSVTQSWNSNGEVMYAMTSANAITGAGSAAEALFDGKIAKDATLTKYLFSKADANANSNGSDAEYAWTIDNFGKITMISSKAIVVDELTIKVKSAARSTTLL